MPFLPLILLVALVLMVLAFAKAQRIPSITDGRQLFDQGELEAARRVFERLARQRSVHGPGREAALFWLGRTFEELGRPDDARRVYQRYLADYDLGVGPRPNPQVLPRVRERLAALLSGAPFAGPEGLGTTTDSTETDPTTLGLADGKRLLENGRFDQARAVFEQVAARATPGDPARESALYLLGLAQEALGRPEDARAAYGRWLDENAATGRPGSARLKAQVDERLAGLEAASGASPLSPWERFNREAPLVRVAPREQRPSERTQVPKGRLVSTDLPPLSLDEVRRDLRRLDAGVRIGGYVLAEKLGEGGMGEVYRALRPVAVKFARSPEAVEHLRRFGTLQGKIDSPRIVKPLEVALEADPPYVVMEFVDGPTLRALLEARGALDPGLALPILAEVARGLADAHAVGVMHLDLKPENVLLDASGAVKLTDFELGREQGEASQLRLSLSFRSGEVEKMGGTLAYMSPEQRAGKVPDARSDVYTFGVLLFEALTGTLPEPGDRPSDFVPDLPAEIDQLFERCFARLERRHADGRDLVKELERALERVPGRLDLAQAVAEVPKRLADMTPPRSLSKRAEREAVVRAIAETALAPVPETVVTPVPVPVSLPVPVEPVPVEPVPVPVPEPVEPAVALPAPEPASIAAPRPPIESLLAARPEPEIAPDPVEKREPRVVAEGG